MLALKTRDEGQRDVRESIGHFICRLFQQTVIEPRKLNMTCMDMAMDGTRVKVKLAGGAVGWVPIQIIYNEPIKE